MSFIGSFVSIESIMQYKSCPFAVAKQLYNGKRTSLHHHRACGEKTDLCIYCESRQRFMRFTENE